MIILWIDPWTTTVGFALIEKEKQNYFLLDYWILKTIPKTDLNSKLLEIWNDIHEIIIKNKPDILTIEKIYFQNNIKTAIDVAEARWVIIYEAIKNNVKIQEYTPLQVKKAITWNGKANKIQLQNAIKIFFQLENTPKPDDVADAIWLAYMWALNTKEN
jgi:crossover junction endodeoxyribonuclease RuvC